MKNQKKPKKIQNSHILLYNPHAGKKRHLGFGEISLAEVKKLLLKYQIPTDFRPITSFNKIGQIVKESLEQGYKTILVAGGDGTVGEVASCLVNQDATLGVLPFGSFMNIGRMLAMPTDLEKAVMTIKSGRVFKIDVGKINKLEGEKVDEPHYFMEGASLGFEASFQQNLLSFEKGNFNSIGKVLKHLRQFEPHTYKVEMDENKIEAKLANITVSNGPITGAAVQAAPESRLNDHRLTVTFFPYEQV